MSDDFGAQVVALAIQAAGPVGGNDRAWLHRIQELTPRVAALLRPPLQGQENNPASLTVTARKVLEASVFKGEYVDHSLEESSQRIIARFRSETTNKDEKESDGTEHIRTEPMWSAAGRLMRSILDGLQPGQEAMLYKHMEQISPGKNVRVLVHLVPVGRPPERQTQDRAPVEPVTTPAPPAGSAPATRGETGGERNAPPVSRPPSTDVPPEEPHGEWWVAVQDRLKELTPRQMVGWKALCRGKGVQNFMDPQSEQDFNKVLLAFGEIKKQEEPKT